MRFSSVIKANISLTLRKQLENLAASTTTKSFFNENSINQLDQDLQVKIGLEIHARIAANSKIFSDSECFDISNSLANSSVSYFDAALPGTMPCINM